MICICLCFGFRQAYQNRSNSIIFDSTFLAPVVQRLDSAIHWITQLVLLVFIRLIVIYPVDSAIDRLNNWGLMDSNSQPLSNWGLVTKHWSHITAGNFQLISSNPFLRVIMSTCFSSINPMWHVSVLWASNMHALTLSILKQNGWPWNNVEHKF